MADDAGVRSRVSAIYDWHQHDIAQVKQATQEVILRFLGPEYRFSGSLSRGGATEITQDYSSFDSWSAALSAEWDWFIISASSTDWSRKAMVNFNIKEQQIRTNLDMAGADGEPLKKVMAELQKVIPLADPKPLIPMPKKPKERLEGRYHVEYPEDITWFQKLLSFLESWVGHQEYFNGSFSLLSAPQFHRSPSQYADWKDKCVSMWKDILDLNAIINGERRECSARYYANRAELTVTLSSYDAKELTDQFAALEKELPILPPKDLALSDSSKGERRRYFAAEQIDKRWFERGIGLVRSFAKGNTSFQGRFRVAGPDGEDFSYSNYEAWHQEVTSKWDALTWIYCWISAPEISITMDLDLLRDSVSLDLQSPTEDMITEGFNSLELGLKIVKVQGNPYRIRRFLRTFRIERWTTNKEYAAALREAVKFVFPDRTPGRRLALTTAYVTVGESKEDLEPFTDYQLFCERIESPDEFTRAELVLEGPHGRLLGIVVNRQTKILMLRTSIERADLDNLTRPFQNALDLTLKESKDEPDKEEPKGEKINKVLVLTSAVSLLCVVLTGSFGLLTSQVGLSPLHTRYSLEITYPQGQSGTPVKRSDLRVEWKLISKTITGDHPDLHSRAMVSVLRDGTTQPQTYAGDDGHAVVDLAPGSNFIKVVSAVDQSTQTSINVVMAPDEPTSGSVPHGSKIANKTRSNVKP